MESLLPVVEGHASTASAELGNTQDAHQEAIDDAALITGEITTLSSLIGLVESANDNAQSALAIANDYQFTTAQQKDHQRA